MSETTPGDAAAEAASEDPATTGDEEERSDVVLEVENLRKEFGALVATDDATFDVERGTITGLIGPNGAGKSTIFNLISGFYEPDAGTVRLNGDDVTGMVPYKIANRGLIRTFQTPRKLEGMTVREAMMIGPQRQPGESFLRVCGASGTSGSAPCSRSYTAPSR